MGLGSVGAGEDIGASDPFGSDGLSGAGLGGDDMLAPSPFDGFSEGSNAMGSFAAAGSASFIAASQGQGPSTGLSSDLDIVMPTAGGLGSNAATAGAGVRSSRRLSGGASALDVSAGQIRGKQASSSTAAQVSVAAYTQSVLRDEFPLSPGPSVYLGSLSSLVSASGGVASSAAAASSSSEGADSGDGAHQDDAYAESGDASGECDRSGAPCDGGASYAGSTTAASTGSTGVAAPAGGSSTSVRSRFLGILGVKKTAS